MSNNVPRPSAKPVWPIVVACLVLVVGIMVAAVFIGMNLSDSDDQAAGRGHAPAYAADDDSGSSDDTEDAAANQKKKSKTDDSKKAKSEPDDEATQSPDEDVDEKSDKPKKDPPESTSDSPDSRLDCGSAKTLLTTRTETFGASICRTANGASVYRGLSENIDGSLVLHASFDEASNQWLATNQTYEYTIDAATGQLTIRNHKTGEYDTEPAVKFRAK